MPNYRAFRCKLPTRRESYAPILESDATQRRVRLASPSPKTADIRRNERPGEHPESPPAQRDLANEKNRRRPRSPPGDGVSRVRRKGDTPRTDRSNTLKAVDPWYGPCSLHRRKRVPGIRTPAAPRRAGGLRFRRSASKRQLEEDSWLSVFFSVPSRCSLSP